MLLRNALLGSLLAVPLGLLAGCGSNSNVSVPPPLVSVPAIATQPQSEAIPMGLPATFSVVATGPALSYQWFKNGASLSGATASTYTTPAVAFSDTGSSFKVQISNTAGIVTSSPASLTVTARAPKAGDLRFQQVDAETTVNGYSRSGALDIPQACLVADQSAFIQYDPAGTGSSYFLGNDPCSMKYTTFALPSSVTGSEVVYASLPFAKYQADLADDSLWIHMPSPSDAGSVIDSLRLTPTTAGVSFVHSDQTSGFSGSSATVSVTSLAEAARQEGQHGRVITALSYDGINVTYFSYGWAGDPSSVYESIVAFATLSTAADAVTSLASEGYILTAAGGTQAADGSGVILVGTRVQGDTMPRPVSVGTYTTASDTTTALMNQGYAIVAVIQQYDASGAITSYQFVGER